MKEKLLFVDDEPAALDSYRRLLHKEFDLGTATSGPEAIQALSESGPFAVVVSDMQMPGMDGIQLLKKVREIAPDTVRLMLTGHANIDVAIDAVNEGNIFRFLTKPCSRENMLKATQAAIHQHRLITAEKELLEKTLSGAIQVLTEVLSLVNPTAFSRSVRIRRYVEHIAAELRLLEPWRFEAAAMMSQLGCVTLHPDTLDAVYGGHSLPPEEQARYNEHPLVARDLLSKIPRLEPVAWMITHQNDPLQIDLKNVGVTSVDIVSLGAQILKTTLAFDQLVTTGNSASQACQYLRERPQDYDPLLVDTLQDLPAMEEEMDLTTCAIKELRVGMMLQEEVRTVNGILVVAKGQEITPSMMARLQNFWEKKSIGNTVLVMRRRNVVTQTNSTSQQVVLPHRS